MKVRPTPTATTRTLQDNLEDMERNLRPPEPTYENFFTLALQRKAYSSAQAMALAGMAVQQISQQQLHDTYSNIRQKIEDMVQQRPAIRKELLGQVSQVTKEAEMAFDRGMRNREAFAKASARGGDAAAAMSMLARTKEMQKQELNSSLAAERIKERTARQQLYRSVIQRQNQSIQNALSGVQQIAQSQGGMALSGLNTALGGMLAAGADVTGAGIARGQNELAAQEQGLGLQTSTLDMLASWNQRQTAMLGRLDAEKWKAQAQRESERLNTFGNMFNMASGLGGFFVQNTGIGNKLGNWFKSKLRGSDFMNKLFDTDWNKTQKAITRFNEGGGVMPGRPGPDTYVA